MSEGVSVGEHRRLPVLDGVRALSIIAVLATHFMPAWLFGQSWSVTIGVFGMALFFILSGFLITEQLLRHGPPLEFAKRRLLRVVPAAWLCALIVALFQPIDADVLLGHLFFYANLPPQSLVKPLDHYWSLCVEVQFYVIAFFLLWLRPAATRWALPIMLAGTSLLRIHLGATNPLSITWYRIDDLLAGGCLALVFSSRHWPAVRGALDRSALPWLAAVALFAACVALPVFDNWLSYLRPYAAAAFVATLLASSGGWMTQQLKRPWMHYVAQVSYAVYIWHLPLAATWLGSGDLLEKYLKRPLLLLAVFAVAHLSTFYFERPILALGKRQGRRVATQET